MGSPDAAGPGDCAAGDLLRVDAAKRLEALGEALHAPVPLLERLGGPLARQRGAALLRLDGGRDAEELYLLEAVGLRHQPALRLDEDHDALGVIRRGRHAGDGPPFVYLHSTLGESAMWLPFLHTWSQQFRVLAPMHPGFGQSGG